jgi:hypothetical protein
MSGRAQKIAKAPTAHNFDDIIKLMEEAAGERFDGLRGGFEALRDDRNLIAHGCWLMVDDKPWVVWHKFIEDMESIIGQYFEKPRFEAFMKKGDFMWRSMCKYHDMLEDESGVRVSALCKLKPPERAT